MHPKWLAAFLSSTLSQFAFCFLSWMSCRPMIPLDEAKDGRCGGESIQRIHSMAQLEKGFFLKGKHGWEYALKCEMPWFCWYLTRLFDKPNGMDRGTAGWKYCSQFVLFGVDIHPPENIRSCQNKLSPKKTLAKNFSKKIMLVGLCWTYRFFTI